MACVRPTAAPIFLLHLAKMAGRSMVTSSPSFTGQHLCAWTSARPEYLVKMVGRPSLDYGSSVAFAAAVKAHAHGLIEQPCMTTFEISWNSAMESVFGPAGVTPLVFTMLRDPRSWVVSAIEHDMHVHRHSGLDDLYRRGCFSSCNKSGYDYTKSTLLMLNGGSARNDTHTAQRRLEGMIFGLVDEFESSMCLWAFQMGRFNSFYRSKCDCTARQSLAKSDKHIGHHSAKTTSALFQHASQQAVAALNNISFTPDYEVYDYGTNLFFERIRVAERRLGMRLICPAPKPAEPAKP